MSAPMQTIFEVVKDGETIQVKKCDKCLEFRRLTRFPKVKRLTGVFHRRMCDKCIGESRKRRKK